jgi:hypothetical protein
MTHQATVIGLPRMTVLHHLLSKWNQETQEMLMNLLQRVFQKTRVSHLVTFNSGQHCSQIDFILARREDRHACLDCKVIPVECVVPQHKLMIADFRFRLPME